MKLPAKPQKPNDNAPKLTTNPPQLELLPPTETPAMNPLVAAALKRIERAHQSAAVETRPPRTSLATAVAYAPEREENIMNETVPPTIQLEFETEPVPAELSPAVEKSHLAIVPPPPSEPEPIKAEAVISEPVLQSEPARRLAEPPPVRPARRLIVDDDPALNYLDSIPRNIRVDEMASQSASAFRRVVSAVLDLIFCALLTAPIAGALYLSGENLQEFRVIAVLGGSRCRADVYLSDVDHGVDRAYVGNAITLVARDRHQNRIDSRPGTVCWPLVLLPAFTRHSDRYSLRSCQPRGLHCARSIYSNGSSSNLKCTRNSLSASSKSFAPISPADTSEKYFNSAQFRLRLMSGCAGSFCL